MSWVVEELQGLNLGDIRRDLRLMRILQSLADHCEQGFSQAFDSAAEVKAAYRFCENGQVSWPRILAPHQQATVRRCQEQPVVLVAQDTTEINLTHHPTTQGLGYLGSSKCRGLLLHSCLALTPAGTPLGVLHLQPWVRPLEQLGKRHTRHQRPTAEKESQRWLTALAAIGQALPQHPQVVVICDREADLYDLFAAPRPSTIHLLVRVAREQRLVGEHVSLRAALATEPIAGYVQLQVPRGGVRVPREATLAVRYKTLEIPAPRRFRAGVCLPLQYILAEEVSTSPGETPIRWLLATTLPVTCLEDALQGLSYYSRRWGIERFHFTLKSGCQIESRQFEQLPNIERMAAVYSIVAWRVLWLTYESREHPHAPCTQILSPSEWQSLVAYTATHGGGRRRRFILPTTPPTLAEAVRMIGRLGGHLGRRGDGPPGVQSVWRGMARLYDIASVWEIVHPPPIGNEDCGQ
jgi:Transposase DNA-binding/Transposase Tn5 dimerisation domain